MAEVRLAATRRDARGKGAAGRMRASGRVPAVVYGHGMEPLSIAVDRPDFVSALHGDAGMNVLFDLQIEGQTVLALTRELQRDPVKGTVLHADFVKVDRTQEVDVEVPLHLAGEAPGVKEGGVLEHPLSTLHVRCRATEVPEAIEADVSGLNVGDTLRVSDLSESPRYQILNDPDTVVAAVAAPVSEAELEAMEAAVSGAVPEAAEVAAAGEAEERAATGVAPGEEEQKTAQE